MNRGDSLFVRGISLALFALLVMAAPAQDEAPIRVAVSEVQAFTMPQGERWTGFDIEYFSTIAEELDRDIEWVAYDNVEEKLSAVTGGDADVAIGGISITSQREEAMDFSVPNFNSKLSIMVYHDRTSFDSVRTFLLAFANRTLWISVIIFSTFILFGGFVLWYTDRGSEDCISSKFIPGLFEGIWCAFATATTIGYGDIAPKTWTARLATIPIALSGFVVLGSLMSSLSAAITSQALKHDIQGPQDLQGRVVGAKEGTTAVDSLRNRGATVLELPSVHDARSLLIADEISSYVGDNPSLVYYIRTHQSDKFELASAGFDPQYYGYAFPPGSPLREEVNRVHLHLKETGVYDEMYTLYFGASEN